MSSRSRFHLQIPRIAMRLIGLAIFFLLGTCPASPVDWKAFAASSDGKSDAVLLDAFTSGDTSTRLDICEGLGQRTEPSAGVFIELIADGHRGNASWDASVFLRALLASLFRPTLDATVLRARIDSNASALDGLFSRARDWCDPQLVEQLVDLAPLCSGTARLGALRDVGDDLLQKLSSPDGALMPQDTSLALAYLEAVRAIGIRIPFSMYGDGAPLPRWGGREGRARHGWGTYRASVFLIDSDHAWTPQDFLDTGTCRLSP